MMDERVSVVMHLLKNYLPLSMRVINSLQSAILVFAGAN